MPRLHFCFVGSRPAMTVLAWIAVLPFDLRGAPPVLLITIGRPGSSPPRSLPKRAFNAVPQQTASAEIPIASDAHPRHTSRGFLPWRFAYAGPRVRRATVMGPPSANLHRTGPHMPFYEESDATRAARLFRLAYGRRLRCLLKTHSGVGPTLLSMTLSR
jgi:hypothetical protein